MRVFVFYRYKVSLQLSHSSISSTSIGSGKNSCFMARNRIRAKGIIYLCVEIETNEQIPPKWRWSQRFVANWSSCIHYNHQCTNWLLSSRSFGPISRCAFFLIWMHESSSLSWFRNGHKWTSYWPERILKTEEIEKGPTNIARCPRAQIWTLDTETYLDNI